MMKTDRTAILPGAALGVLGGGQLGRMFALAARSMGYRVHVLCPSSNGDTPTGQIADREINADYDDLDAVAAFARDVSVVTFEFENVPAATTQAAARYAPVRPGGQVLHISQNRVREKTFLHKAGLPVTPFAAVGSLGELEAMFGEGGESLSGSHPRAGAQEPAPSLADSLRSGVFPKGVLKTASWGYDGKGQALIHSTDDVSAAWESLGGQEAILEAFIEFEREISVVAARGVDGSIACVGPIANTHRHHILDLSVCPAGVDARVAAEAVDIARQVMEKLEVVGVLCVEFFVKADGDLLINELAPRPHNSGHLSLDACVTSQFEQQVRTVCGLPLGSAELLRPAAMANLLGDLWEAKDMAAKAATPQAATPGVMPNFAAALAMPQVKLHLYGKHEPRPGRKMGHLTALADTTRQAAALAIAARKALATDEHG